MEDEKIVYAYDGTTKKFIRSVMCPAIVMDGSVSVDYGYPKHCTEIAPPITQPIESAYFENEKWVVRLDADKQAAVANLTLINQREENIAMIPDLIKRIEVLEAVVLKG